MTFTVSSRWSAEPPEQVLAPGFQLVDQRLLLLGGLDERRPFGGISWLFIPIADAPSQVDSCLPEPGQVILDKPELFGERGGGHGWLCPVIIGSAHP
jgi:hypothetical protein